MSDSVAKARQALKDRRKKVDEFVDSHDTLFRDDRDRQLSNFEFEGEGTYWILQGEVLPDMAIKLSIVMVEELADKVVELLSGYYEPIGGEK